MSSFIDKYQQFTFRGMNRAIKEFKADNDPSPVACLFQVEFSAKTKLQAVVSQPTDFFSLLYSRQYQDSTLFVPQSQQDEEQNESEMEEEISESPTLLSQQ